LEEFEAECLKKREGKKLAPKDLKAMED